MSGITTTQALAYLRVVGKKTTDGPTFRQQREAIQEFARTRRIKIIKEFCDKTIIDASHRNERIPFLQMVATASLKGPAYVIIESKDRLAETEDLREAILIFLACKDIHVFDASAGEELTAHFKQDDEYRQAILLQTMFARAERIAAANDLRRLKAAISTRSPRASTTKPYGSLPGEEKVLQRIKALYRKPRDAHRRRYSDIAVILNDEGFSPRRAKKWTGALVRNVLQNVS